MKSNVRSTWQEGTSLRAMIEEIIDDSIFIVSVEGKLFRVKNETQKRFHKNEQIYLIVFGKSPFELRLDPQFYNQRSFERFA